MKLIRLGMLFVLPLTLMVSGCGEPAGPKMPVMKDAHDDHDHDHAHGHDHPETFVGVVEELVELRNAIRDGFKADDADAAHGPLHEVGEMLAEVLPTAEKEGLDAGKLKTVNDAVKSLTEAFTAVDTMMHGGEGSEYKDVSDKVDAAIAVLVATSGASADGHHEEDHAEEGHADHGEAGHKEDAAGDHDAAEEKK